MKNSITWLLPALFVTVAAAPGFAQGQWDREKGDCDAVFASADSVVLPKLKQCVAMWQAYVDPNLVKPKEQQRLKNVFQALYNRGVSRADEEAEYLSTAAARHLGVKLQLKLRHTPKQPVRNNGPEQPEKGTATASRRVKFVAPEVSARDRKKAAKLVKAGVKFFHKGKRDKAKAKYEKALELDPGNLDGLFNLAAELAHRKDAKGAVRELQKLQDIGSDAANTCLRQARVDPDFVPIHDYTPYKRVSGYARIKVVNSLGEFGEDEVDRIVKTLEKLSHQRPDTGVDKVTLRKAPVIWFKEHSAPTAFLVKKVVLHPGTTMTKITWDTDYDILVSWGNKIVEKDGMKQPQKDYTDYTPEQGEKRMDNLLREEDKILRKPEQAARKVDHAIATPDRVEQKAKSSVDRVEKTVDTIEKTGDKIKGIFK